jgi:hypothetical protein
VAQYWYFISVPDKLLMRCYPEIMHEFTPNHQQCGSIWLAKHPDHREMKKTNGSLDRAVSGLFQCFG